MTFSINRDSTYLPRLFLDECLPPFLRDNKYFMYPFFYVWFKGKNVRNIMEFKSNFHKYTEKEFRTLNKELDSFAQERPTDLNTHSLQYMIDHLDPHASAVLDVGCGRGKFLKKVQEKGYRTAGCDLYHDPLLVCDDFFESNAEALPFADKTFDIVTCSHTLEHTRNVHRAVSELKRIAIKQLMVTAVSYTHLTLPTKRIV